MTLQTRDLVMLGLSVQGDKPPNAIQPRLDNGNHLRWFFRRDYGFPWYGFHLFRRQPPNVSISHYLSTMLGDLQTGAWPDIKVDLPIGQIRSDRNLVFTDDFSRTTVIEFDLFKREYFQLNLNPDMTARYAWAQIGFREVDEENFWVNFTQYTTGLGPNPRMEHGVRFTVRDSYGQPVHQTRITKDQNGIPTLVASQELEIRLPYASSVVGLALADYAAGATVEAFNLDGTFAGSMEVHEAVETGIEGTGISLIRIRGSETYFYGLWYSHDVIQVEATWENATVDRCFVRGDADQVIWTKPLKANAISAIKLSPGPAALVDACIITVSQHAGSDWEPVPNFPYPMQLPVSHPDYPCTPGESENLEAARKLARGRIRYGNPDRYLTPSHLVYSTGFISIKKGSSLVTGNGTQWDDSLVGAVLQVEGDTTAYTVMNVDEQNTLVLSRNYEGTSNNRAVYTIRHDPFGQLHDYLANLVTGGLAAGPMAKREIPKSIYSDGTISLINRKYSVNGYNTKWKTITEEAGLTLRVENEIKTYPIEEIKSDTELKLSQPYLGFSGGNKKYVITKALSSPEEVEKVSQTSSQNPLDMVLLHCLHPAMAQMTGLYWVDRQISRGKYYDYLLLGDYTGCVSKQELPRKQVCRFETIKPGIVRKTSSISKIACSKHPEFTISLEQVVNDRVAFHVYEIEAIAPFNTIKRRAICFDENELVFVELAVPASQVQLEIITLPISELKTGVSFGNHSAETIPNPTDINGITFINRDHNGDLMQSSSITGDGFNCGYSLEIQLPAPCWLVDMEIIQGAGTDTVVDVFNEDGTQWTESTNAVAGGSGLAHAQVSLFGTGINRLIIRGGGGEDSLLSVVAWHCCKVSTREETEQAVQVTGHSRNGTEYGPFYNDNRSVKVVGQEMKYLTVRPLRRGVLTGLVSINAMLMPDMSDVINREGIEAFILFDMRVEATPSLTAPSAPRAYALPDWSATPSSGAAPDATGRAGLAWDVESLEDGLALAKKSFMYHLWRADLGETEPTAEPPLAQYQAITYDPDTQLEKPILIGKQLPTENTPTYNLPNWPPCTLHAVDSGRADGWYSYRVNGIDIFGRHSPLSTPANWFQWEPIPNPRPWYYEDPPGGRSIHPYAIHLADKLPPPPPTGIEAYVLDPTDPFIQKDEAYEEWLKTIPPEQKDSIIGLRVRWKWTSIQALGAPDMREFRVYYQPGMLNVLSGNTVKVLETNTSEQSEVETDIPNTQPHNTYIGAWLRIGADSFLIIGSETESPLRLRVQNLRPKDNVSQKDDTSKKDELSPRALAPCSIVFPPDHTAGSISLTKGSAVVTGARTEWHAELVGRILKVSGESIEYKVIQVDAESQKLTLDHAYNGITGSEKSYTLRHPLFLDYRAARNWSKRIHVEPYSKETQNYEVFLLAPDANAGEPFAPSQIEPLVYANIGVSAVDKRRHTEDDPVWSEPDRGGWGGADRFGNEGRLGPPACIFRVQREPPAPPVPPPADSDRIYATPADYHGRSFFTYRWVPVEHLKAHISRALDDAVFKTDWTWRCAVSISEKEISTDDMRFFPEEWHGSEAKRQQIADEINQLNLYGNDPEGKSQSMLYYRGLSNDALRVLAGLPHIDRAFSQLTIKPLDPKDPDTANQLGPDNPPDYPVDPNLRIFIDTLDGRTTNRYFYRVVYVDGVHNRSKLSLSSPPVYLPNVTPPRAPVITKVLSGDRRITLYWASNREPDLVEYRIYRVDRKEHIRDLRLMTLVHTEMVPAGDPMIRPAEMSWTDIPVPGLVLFRYCIVAVDDAGNMSSASQAVGGQATDAILPALPIEIIAKWVLVDNSGNEFPFSDTTSGLLPAIRLGWKGESPYYDYLIQRCIPPTGIWQTVMPWTSTQHFWDTSVDASINYEYRILTRKPSGLFNTSPAFSATGK